MTSIGNHFDTTHALRQATLSQPVSVSGGQAEPFARLVAPQDAATDRVEATQEDQLRQAAQSLVSITLIQPLLAQVRDDPFRSELFHGGMGEDAFGKQLDDIFAQRIVQSTNLPIVESIYQNLSRVGHQVDAHG